MVQSQDLLRRIVDNVETVIVGKRAAAELAVVALAAQGHLLIEDVPGVGKTMLARALARSVGGSFQRIQFTPDLLPTDITGVSIFQQQRGEFEFRPGPIFANLVLADEINRATPKTQSALLEAMEERHVTVEGTTRPLPRPFMVLATQNPIEYEGTFPLPEAQLDRFLLRLRLGYPSAADEMLILERQQRRHPIETVEQVVGREELLALQERVREVHFDRAVRQYLVELVGATREHPDVALGASPRASVALFHAAQVRALLGGRDYVIPDDVKALAEPVLAHRLIVTPAARVQGITATAVIEELLESVPLARRRVSA